MHPGLKNSQCSMIMGMSIFRFGVEALKNPGGGCQKGMSDATKKPLAWTIPLEVDSRATQTIQSGYLSKLLTTSRSSVGLAVDAGMWSFEPMWG